MNLDRQLLLRAPWMSSDMAQRTFESGFSTKRVVQVAALLTLSVSALALLGRVAHWPILSGWVPGAPGMAPESVIASLLAALGLWLAQQRKALLVRVLACSLMVPGFFNLAAIPNGAIRHMLSKAASLAPGPAVSVVFTLLGIGLFLLSLPKISLPVLWAVAVLGAVVKSIGLITLLGYASGLNSTLWWKTFLQMPVPTAVVSSALGMALVAFSFQPSRLSRQGFSVTLAVSASLGLLLLFAGINAVWTSSDAVDTALFEIRAVSDRLIAIQTLVGAVRKAETEQRGYLLTGERKYLQAFRSAPREFEQVVRQTPGLDARLLKTMQLKFNELNFTVALESQGLHREALRVVKTSQGYDLMHDIDAQAGAIADRLRKRLVLRMYDSQRSFSSVRRTILWCCGLALLFAGSALLLILTEMRRRSRIETNLIEKEATLATTNTELREQTLRAEEANRAKSSFLASMSHEIRTPMNAILGMADMLWESELSQMQRHYVEIFRRAGGTLLTLINDILDLSKIESGNFSLESVDFDLREVVEQVMEILTPKADSKALALLAHIEPGTISNVVGDPARLQQVLLNLLGNAIKFTDAGQVLLRVRSQNLNGEASVEFEVSDTGIGIPADKLSSIFDDFTQAESSITRRFGGTGLGLGISFRLVTRMRGELQVRSELGRGSTFSFSVMLPIAEEQKASGPVRFDEIAGRYVLIVDNNATNRVILSEMCSAWEMHVTTCGSGAEAIALTKLKAGLAGQQFAVALVDRAMPGMDGFETATQMRVLDPTIAILIVSSDSQAGDVSRCRELGFSGHIMKPVRRSELLHQIVKALSNPTEPAVIVQASGPLNLPADTDGKVKILAAEDSEDNRFLLQAYCKGTKYDLTFAADGVQAVEAYRAGSFDLVVMDVQMPVMDGLTATRKIRAIETDLHRLRTPILAMTANALPEDVTSALAAGCDSHLAKPTSRKNFLKALEQWPVTPRNAKPPVPIEIPEGLEQLAHTYLNARQLELPLLEDLLKRSDFGELCRLAHNLKGTGTSYGFPEISRLGGSIEQSLKERNLTGAAEQFTELSSYTRAASEQLQSV